MKPRSLMGAIGCTLVAAFLVVAPSTAAAAGPPPLPTGASAIVGFTAPLGVLEDYSTGTPSTGVPPLTSAGCFTGPAAFNGAVNVGVAVVANTGGREAEYVGFVTISGTLNEGPCTNFVEEIGSVTNLTLSGANQVGMSLSCGPFSGYLDRFAVTAVTLLAIAPSCNVSGVVTGPVGMVITGVWAPTVSQTAGVTTPTQAASVAGTLTLEGTA
jgi:hypothetical protein